MNALTNHRTAAAPAIPAIPAFSPRLRSAVALAVEPVRRYAGAGDEASFVIAAGPITPDAATIEEARRILPAAEAVAAPASREHIRKWFMAVNGGVANPLDSDAFTLRLNAILTICGDAPASAWSADTLKAALARWKFAPSAAEVSALIEERAAPIRRQAEALRKVAEAQPDRPKAPSAPREAPTDAERAEAAATVAQLKVAFASNRAAALDDRAKPTPRFLTDAQLLTAYEAQLAAGGGTGIEARVRHLREKLGITPQAQSAG